MNPEHILSILTLYLIALKVRDHFTEKPDPKLTYATIKNLHHLDSLVRKNTEHIATLIAQHQYINQRLTEITQK